MLKKLWNDDAGVVTLEYLVLGTFLGLALIVGVTAVAASLNGELSELSQAIGTFNQNYSSTSYANCSAQAGGSSSTGDVANASNDITNSATGTITAVINDELCN